MYTRFAAVSRAAHDAAAAAKIRFVDNTYRTRGAIEFARRNADRVTSLGAFLALDFASIRMYCQLGDLQLDLELGRENVALLPCSLTELVITLDTVRMDWSIFRPLCCLQELDIYNWDCTPGFGVQLDDSFATALPLLRVFHVSPGFHNQSLATTAKVVMPHLVELTMSNVNIVHLNLHFMTALKSLRLSVCTVSIVSAACNTMELCGCGMKEGTVLVTPNLRSLTIYTGGLHKLDGSRCRYALSIMCYFDSSIEWVGAEPHVENLRDVAENFVNPSSLDR